MGIALEEKIGYAKQWRTQFCSSIVSFQAVNYMIADMATAGPELEKELILKEFYWKDAKT